MSNYVPQVQSQTKCNVVSLALLGLHLHFVGELLAEDHLTQHLANLLGEHLRNPRHHINNTVEFIHTVQAMQDFRYIQHY